MTNIALRLPKEKYTYRDIFACAALFFYLIRRPVVTALVYILGTPPEFNVVASTVLMYIPLVIAVCMKGNRKKIGIFALVWASVLLFCLGTYALHPEYKEWLFIGEFNIWDYIFAPNQYLYLLLFIGVIGNPKKVLQTVKFSGLILLAYNIYRLYYAEFVRGYWNATGVGGEGEGEYNLAFGYDMLLLFALFTIVGKFEKKPWYYLCSLVSLVCIMIAGSRGPLLGVALTVLVVVYDWIREKSIATRVTLMLSLAVSMLLVILNIATIMQLVGNIMQSLGFSSRTAELLAGGDYNDDNGRLTLWGIALELIVTGGPLGNGIYGDRYVIDQRTTMWMGYCHNIVLEMLVDFGYVFGVILIAVLVWRVVVNVRAKDSEHRTLYLVFLITSSQLLLSGSFWYSMSFWGCVAVDICCNRFDRSLIGRLRALLQRLTERKQ